MLEYFSYKKYKDHKDKVKEAEATKEDGAPADSTIPATKSAEATQATVNTPLLDKEDEQYFSDLIEEAETPVVILEGASRAESPPTPLPTRPSQISVKAEEVGGVKPQVSVPADNAEGLKGVGSGESVAGVNEGLKETEESKKAKAKDGKLFSQVEKRASTLFTSGLDMLRLGKKDGEKEAKVKTEEGSDKENKADKKEKEKKKDKGKEKAKKEKVEGEGEVDEGVLASVMEKLNFSTINGKLVAKSPDIKATVNKFTQILKDINNGVPTAYNDLLDLFDTSSDTFARTFDSLPKTLQNFIMRTLPSKLTPEVLRTLAATSPALAAELQSGSALGLKELVTKPGLVASLLKGVVTFLRTRFPLLMGGGMAVSFGVTIVMLILWYCYKRGKEVRLEEEAKSASVEGENEGESSHSASGSQPQPTASDFPPPPQPVPQTSFDRDIGHTDKLHETGP